MKEHLVTKACDVDAGISVQLRDDILLMLVAGHEMIGSVLT
ncbi:hypothetical protein M758_6G113500 [Ceratodon purpureus]|uniref:Uncharacterized protein n=1 Tax=Ceratodon purpureus TaxID=3225 RepID=A0A8T0HXU3_CERPU|nr:hypothetical protein KC19_VG333400 [Ceratodon purpureus]KAG0613580.1 hypothetical protein M758_6G113500 [Ceratodon purpureus]